MPTIGFRNAALAAAAVLATGAFSPSPSQASFIGDTVDIHIDFTDGVTTDVHALGMLITDNPAIPEIFFAPSTGGNVNVDIGADSIAIGISAFGFFSPGSVAEFQLTIEGLDWVGDPGAIITGLTHIFGDNHTTLQSFGDHDVAFLVPTLTSPSGLQVRVDQFQLQVQLTAAPEPGTAALLALGLAGLALRRLRRR